MKGRTVRGRDRALILRTLGPALALLICATLFPDWSLFFVGAGLGWLVVAQFVFRGTTRMQYRKAIGFLRKGEYAQAVAVMDPLVSAEPDDPAHRQFRAGLYRLAGRLDEAASDYRAAVQSDPAATGAWIGLAEVHVQRHDYDEARAAARSAESGDPGDWTASYTLGMIADREGDAPAAIEALDRAVGLGIARSRDRLLAHLWLARAYTRLGRADAAQGQVAALRKEAGSLDEWRLILSSDQGRVLRPLLEADIDLAAQWAQGSAPLEVLGHDLGR